jgi:hypothetical protein
MMSDMKEHFQTATNTVAAHNAAMLQEAQWDPSLRVVQPGVVKENRLGECVYFFGL